MGFEGDATHGAKGYGAWRGPRAFGFCCEGHRPSAGRTRSSFQRATPTWSTDGTGGQGQRRGYGVDHRGEKRSDSKYVLKVTPVRFSDKEERSIQEKSQGCPRLLHSNWKNELAADREGRP